MKKIISKGCKKTDIWTKCGKPFHFIAFDKVHRATQSIRLVDHIIIETIKQVLIKWDTPIGKSGKK